MSEMLAELHDVITRARSARLPVAGARIHMGERTRAELLREASQPSDLALYSFWGVPVIEEPDHPALLELRWTVRA